MNKKLLKTLSLIIATTSLMSLAGCTINVDQDLIDSLKGETTEVQDRDDEDEDDRDDNDRDSERDNSSEEAGENTENDEVDEPASNGSDSADAGTHDPNQTLEGVASLEDQINCIVNSRSTWAITNPSDSEYYAITDFDNDGRYEILCVTTGGSGKYTQSYIYEVNGECTGVTLIAEFEPEYSWESSTGEILEVDWCHNDYNYSLLPDGTYCYEVFDIWSASATEFGVVKINLAFNQSGISTTRLGTYISSDDNVEYYDANLNAISENDYETLFDSTMLSGTRFGSIHISYTSEYYNGHPFSDVSDSDLYTILMDSANDFGFYAG